MLADTIAGQVADITETQLQIIEKFRELEAERDRLKLDNERYAHTAQVYKDIKKENDALRRALKSEYCPCDTCEHYPDCPYIFPEDYDNSECEKWQLHERFKDGGNTER